MTKNKIDIVNNVDKFKQLTLDMLEEAKLKDFEEVIIIGRKDNKFYINGSGNLDSLKSIGALELAKFELLNKG
jgi:hypothetical protein